MIVIDASVLAPALGDDGSDGGSARARMRGERLAAPSLVDLEVATVFRAQRASGLIDDRRVELALRDLSALPLRRAHYRYLMGRCWQLRHNLVVYDAVYVALAEALGTPLLTADKRLANAPGIGCAVELIGTATDRGE